MMENPWIEATFMTALIAFFTALGCAYVEVILRRQWSMVAIMIAVFLPFLCAIWIVFFIGAARGAWS